MNNLIASPSGLLELLTALPSTPDNTVPPILFLHGAYCSASCYKAFLPLFASRGIAAYALSLRGHGASWKASWFTIMFLTTLDQFRDDVECAIAHIKERHTRMPVLVGHSFGGGVLQYLLCSKAVRVPGLVLIAAAPLTGGGKDIMANWQRVEAPGGYPWPWSPRSQLDTVEQVRNAFFSPECPGEVIEAWLRESKTQYESARAGLSVLWPFGTAQGVLSALDGLPETGRKVLCISGERDLLVTTKIVRANADAYRAADNGENVITEAPISTSGHHLMLDIARDECASVIINWLKGLAV
ncbi:alpha/beta-hydrolase [Glonium stellatum]|uniref:Alpha/beta-hydrolase n=1 Tax=Glonium stellatum TaxID=574774 RepID=A0A8E2FBB0_9PEZI|nr:alpha/beta-hydrolase [Glonium stellatum]